jgi:hypothetical protein
MIQWNPMLLVGSWANYSRQNKNRSVNCFWSEDAMFQRNGPSAGAEEAERLDLEKHARLEAGLIDPVSAIRPAPTAEHQHREGLSFWQAIKTMFK